MFINQSGKKPMTKRRPTINMQEMASATFYFTCASLHNYYERSYNTRRHIMYEKENDQLGKNS
jgi:hypothetical protein